MGLKFKLLTPVNVFLVCILVLAAFFRLYKIEAIHGFAIDADLYSWIVKDIVYGKHFRLVGQLTSTEGIYIGPLFYYLLSPFFLLTGMNPIAAVIFAAVLGVITVFSFYFVFKKLIGDWAGLIAALLQAILPLRVGFDRWVVPTMTSNLWCIWFFYSLVKILKGDRKYLILGLFLSGLIWHVHLALAPLIILLPLSVILSKKYPGEKILLLGVSAFILPMLPFILFEIRHNFLQTTGLLAALSGSVSISLSEKIAKILNQSLGNNFYLKIFLLLLPFIIYRTRTISLNLLIIIYGWIFSVIGFFILSSKESSEYYFTSTQTIFLIAFVYLISFIKGFKNAGKFITLLIIIFVFVYSVNDLLNQKVNDKGYLQKKSVAQFIKKDSSDKNFPCVSVTYITTPGENTGFKYLFWFSNLKLEEPKSGVANYTIVIPYNLSPGSVEKKFGIIGVIVPQSGYNLEVASNCSGSDFNLSEPLWGYTD